MEKSISSLMRPAYLIPESLPADDLLRDMQLKKGFILAVVIDEYGELAGVIYGGGPLGGNRR